MTVAVIGPDIKELRISSLVDGSILSRSVLPLQLIPDAMYHPLVILSKCFTENERARTGQLFVAGILSFCETVYAGLEYFDKLNIVPSDGKCDHFIVLAYPRYLDILTGG